MSVDEDSISAEYIIFGGDYVVPDNFLHDGIYDSFFESEDEFYDEWPDEQPCKYKVTVIVEKLNNDQ